MQAIMGRLANFVHHPQKSFSLEIFLRREPSAEEIDALTIFVREFCLLEGKRTHDMYGLAILSLNASAPNVIVPLEHPSEPKVPRLGRGAFVSGPGEPHPRHISVRMAYADDRAKDVLSSEAKQLAARFSRLDYGADGAGSRRYSFMGADHRTPISTQDSHQGKRHLPFSICT